MELWDIVNGFSPLCEQETQDRRMMLQYLNLFDDLLLRSNEIAHFTASGWVVNQRRTRVLMVYHNIYQSWSWTGGHADGNPDLLSVAVRETQEETGLMDIRPVSDAPVSLEILTVSSHFKRGRYVVPHLHLNATYLLEADDLAPLRNKPDENSAVQWFDVNEVLHAVSEHGMHAIYQKLNERIHSC